MKILFVADGRSQTAINWIEYFIYSGDEVHLASLYPCQPLPGLASYHYLRVPWLGAELSNGPASGTFLRTLLPAQTRTWLRQQLVPFGLRQASQSLTRLIAAIQPDLVHAMRIPYEGMLAAQSGFRGPLLVSVWGNDFTLHAPASTTLSLLTRLTLERADALHTDCQKDLHLAKSWGFNPQKPALVAPGGGGVQTYLFFPPDHSAQIPEAFRVIQPRGVRAYVRNDTFFLAIPKVRERVPNVHFICPAMQGDAQMEKWVNRLHLEEQVELLPRQTRPQMAELFRSCQVAVSVTDHDGTPNTLLEAMASGCFPVAGDLESLREWITPGVNGLLVPPGDPDALAEAIVLGLGDHELRERASRLNRQIIAERADYVKVMPEARNFYDFIR